MFSQRYILIKNLAVAAVITCLVLSCGDGGPEDPGGGGDDPIIPGVDTIPPANVIGLTAKSPSASVLWLSWFSPGDDGNTGTAAGYDVRYSFSEITDLNWDTATPVDGEPGPKPANNIETIAVRELPSERDIYFALKTFDEAQNISGLSNCAIGTTLDMAPQNIRDLKGEAVNETDFLLTWTATGDDGLLRTASFYDIRYGEFRITEANWYRAIQVTGERAPKGPGEPDSLLITGLNPETNYYFAMKIADEAPNWSIMSNVSPAFMYGVNLWVTRTEIDVGDNLSIIFKCSPTEPTKVIVFERIYHHPSFHWEVFRNLVNEQLPAGVDLTEWDCRDDDGELINLYYTEPFVIKLRWGLTTIDSAIVRVSLPD